MPSQTKFQKSSRRQGPLYVDLLDSSRLVEPVGSVTKGPNAGKVQCRVFFDETPAPRKPRIKYNELGEPIVQPMPAPKQQPPVYHGMTFIPAKLFDDGSADERSLTHSQRVGFLIKSAS